MGSRASGAGRSADEGRGRAAEGLSALLLMGGIVYAMLSGNWGIGAIAFGLGAVVLGLDRLRVARGRPEHAIGWVLVLTGAFVAVDALI